MPLSKLFSRLVFAIGCILSPASVYAVDTAEQTINLDPQVVTGNLPDEPLLATFDAKATIQPIPAQDGADILKHVPGFSIIRKGGTDGDPVLRGMAGSRLTILLDGACSPGGCGQRMDPPTAYVFPSAYDRVIVQKGPQSVIYGPGITAGLVRFERDMLRFTESGANLDSFSTVASFGRVDQIIDARAGTPQFYGRLAGTYARSDDFKDGNSQSVHSAYERKSVQAATGWTPGEYTSFEVSGVLSDGEAAYADRMMDGVKFYRQALSLRMLHLPTEGMVERIESQVFYNNVDHVMDNYSLRTFIPSMMMPNRAVSNPDRQTLGGYTRITAQLGDTFKAQAGADAQYNRHRIRSTSNQDLIPFESMSQSLDGEFRQLGLYSELTKSFTEDARLIGGARVDFWNAKDARAAINTGTTKQPNPTAAHERDDTLGAAFLRYEHTLKPVNATAYIGVGYASRFPDYWELFSKESASNLSAFDTKPEHVTQLDTGLVFKGERTTVSIAVFANHYEDFIMIQNGVIKPAGNGTRTATISRNINANTFGGELGATYTWDTGLYASGSLAYVHGENDTDGGPLAQMPPLEGQLEAGYRFNAWSVGTLLRLVDAQNRIAINQGNIVGQDIGPSKGFAVVSLHGAWQATKWLELAAGVDNLFDATYAEHISRSGSMIAGFSQTTQVNEPGRVLWLRAGMRF